MLRDTNTKGILSYTFLLVLISLYYPTTYDENDHIEVKGKTGQLHTFFYF